MWVGGECGTSWRNYILVYFSLWRLQDLVENFEKAAGFSTIVMVFTSELKQTACSDVQTIRKSPPLLVWPLKFSVLYMRSGSSWTVPDSPFHVRECAGGKGKSCAWVLGQFIPLSIFSHTLGAMKSAPRKTGRNLWSPKTAWKQSQGIQQHLVQQDHTLSA